MAPDHLFFLLSHLIGVGLIVLFIIFALGPRGGSDE